MRTLISGGELESPDAGDPARLIRLRYRETAELIKVRGKMCVLMINDLDAGAGRFDEGTQYTVNTQLVNATLMNIADNPTDVQLPGSYDSNPLHRVPIIVTGNDFSTLYAPLIRDGRMEKFYWEPTKDDKIGIVGGIFSEDGLSQQDVEKLVAEFPHQAIDFYSALRSRIYDEQILRFIQDVGIERVSSRVVNSNNVPSFTKPKFGLSDLMEIAKLMVSEQKRVEDSHLVEEYNRGALRHQKYFVPHTAETPVYKANTTPNGNQHNTEIPTAHLDPQILEEMRKILTSGKHIGIEYVDQRRFRTGSWKSFARNQIKDMNNAIAALEACLVEHNNDYVRIFAIEPQAKRRLSEIIIHRPNGEFISRR